MKAMLTYKKIFSPSFDLHSYQAKATLILTYIFTKVLLSVIVCNIFLDTNFI